MAASVMSMSESIQASIIIHHQLQQQFRQQSLSVHPEQQPPPQPKGLAFYKQLLLVAALFGIEMCVSFEQIYQILIQQYLGVPLSLVSINGIACGGTSMVLLPVLGLITDRGNNPKLRKLFSLLVGMGMFLCGLALLATCGIIKLSSQRPPPNTTNVCITTTATTDMGVYNQTSPSAESSTWPFTAEPPPPSEPDSDTGLQLPVTAIMSILGFAFIDVGFDMSVSLTRAFILEITPTFQHTRLLVMATVMASMAGTTFSFIGCFDFPGTLGPLFHVEGVAATLVFFCSLLFFIIVLGYSLTSITGLLINRTPKKLYTKLPEQKVTPIPISHSKETETPRTSRRRQFRSLSQKPLQQLSEDKPYIPDILHTVEGDASTKPLLLDDSTKGNNYSAISGNSTSLYPIKDAPETDTQEGKLNRRGVYRNSSFDNTSMDESNDLEAGDDDDPLDGGSELEDTTAPFYKHQPVDNGVAAVLAAIKQSYSMSVSVQQSPIGDFHKKRIDQLQSKKVLPAPQAEPKIYTNKRLVILCAASFFAMGSSLGFIVYVSNTLTIGIFHGQPTAPPGTEGYLLYEKGLRTAALGNLVLYTTYMIISINNTRIIDLIGEKLQFVLCHVFLLVSLLILILTEAVEAYFVFMVFCGAFRTCAFTLPFVLANKFTLEENIKHKVDITKPSKNLGKVMTLIGFLMPAHFICMSTFMGPLMDATGNVWVPLIYSMCSCAMSLIIFIPLFFMKN